MIRLLLTVGLLAALWWAQAAFADEIHKGYLPYTANGEAPVIALPGHGSQFQIDRDWAVIYCTAGSITAGKENNYIIVRCEK